MPDQSFRPSKQFLIRGSIATGIVVVVLLVQTAWFQKIIKRTPKEVFGPVSTTTVGDIIGKDTNGNGIADWEEQLWGLDPTVLYTNGVSNKVIIDEKKRSLNIDGVAPEDLNETDTLARELFTLTSALGQSDEVDSKTLQTIASKIGASIDIKRVQNQYSLKDIQTVQTTQGSLQKYYAAMANVVATFDTTSADIELVISGAETGDFSRITELTAAATQYESYAKSLSAIPVPIGLAQQHLTVVNGFAGIAQSFLYMAETPDNSLVGLAGINIYTAYNKKVSNAFIAIETYLTQYGIL